MAAIVGLDRSATAKSRCSTSTTRYPAESSQQRLHWARYEEGSRGRLGSNVRLFYLTPTPCVQGLARAAAAEVTYIPPYKATSGTNIGVLNVANRVKRFQLLFKVCYKLNSSH